MTEQFTTEIAAGAAVLDEKAPDWFREIDLESLDLSDIRFCVIGQLWREDDDYYEFISFSTYVGALSALAGNELGGYDHTRPWAIDHGFDLGQGDEGKYDDLTEEWREFISARLSEVPC